MLGKELEGICRSQPCYVFASSTLTKRHASCFGVTLRQRSRNIADLPSARATDNNTIEGNARDCINLEDSTDDNKGAVSQGAKTSTTTDSNLPSDVDAWLKTNKKRKTMKLPKKHQLPNPRKGRLGTPHAEESKRRIALQMKRLQGNAAHRQKISETLRGKPKVCSLCGKLGHNRRGCPEAGSSSADEELTFTAKRSKKLSHAETLALREKRRVLRKDRPKSRYKGLSWDPRKERWHVQVWTGTTVKNVGYFEDEEQSAREYDRAALQVKGPLASLNFPVTSEPQRALRSSLAVSLPAVSLPMTTQQSVSLTVGSIIQAWQSGMRRQRVEFLLPDGSEAGALQQDFTAARDMVEAVLVQLKKHPDLEGRISVQWLDRTDFVGAWQSETLAAVLFCTADCLRQLRNIDGGPLGHRLTLVFNPQWQMDGQIISDFGFGKSCREAEDFVRSFQDVFYMQRRRVMGDSIRLFKCFQSQWQVHYIWPNGKGQVLVSTEEEPPTYDRLLTLMRSVPGSKSSRTWVERVLSPDWMPKPTGHETKLSADGKAASVQLASRMQSQGDLRSPTGSLLDSAARLAADIASDADASNRLESLPSEQSSGNTSAELKAFDQFPKRNIIPNLRQADRFADGQAIRDLRLEPVMNLPQWQRQVYGNAFGRERTSGKPPANANSNEVNRLKKLDSHQDLAAD